MIVNLKIILIGELLSICLVLVLSRSYNMPMKECVAKSFAPKKISQIQFGTMDNVEIERVSEVQISSRELFQMPSRDAAPFGCMDSRLGVSDKSSSCNTCG